MDKKFWIIRAIKIYIVVFMALLVVELLKGHLLVDAVLFGLIWSFISTSIFIATRLYYVRKGQACELCNDIPQHQPNKSE